MAAAIGSNLIARVSYSAPGAFVERVVRGAMPASLAIFMLHRLRAAEEGGPDRAALIKMLTFVRRHRYRVMDLEHALHPGTRLTAPTLAFTADDGYADQVELADLFADFEIPLTIFVVTGFINRELWLWDDKVKYLFNATQRPVLSVTCGHETREYRCDNPAARVVAMRDFRNLCKRARGAEMDLALSSLATAAGVDVPRAVPAPFAAMTWDDARRLERRGIRFAPHSHSHRIMSRLSDAEAANEIQRSWAMLQRELANPAPIFCYPTGRWVDFGQREARLLGAVGIKAGVSAEDGTARRADIVANPYALRRLPLPASPERFALSTASFARAYRYVLDRMEHLGGKAASFRTLAARAWMRCGGYGDYRNIDWSAVRRVVFVCAGNICRSPYAEARARALGINASSFGLRATDGAPAYSRAIDNAAVRGVCLSQHGGRSSARFECLPGDLVLGMEIDHVHAHATEWRAAGAQVSLLGLWSQPPTPYIQDPYSRRDRYFQACFARIDAAVAGVAQRLAKRSRA